MNIDSKGWCMAAMRLDSPNQNDRPENQAVDLLVIHNISLPPGEFGGHYITDLFLNRLDCDRHPFFDQLRDLKVSSHFLIRRNGSLIQFVSADKRAWHAGVSSYRGRQGCNDRNRRNGLCPVCAATVRYSGFADGRFMPPLSSESRYRPSAYRSGKKDRSRSFFRLALFQGKA